jgi:hypothetical protein
VFCSFLALVFKKALEDRIGALARSGSWPQIIADLDSLTETEIEHDSKRSSATRHVRPPASPARGRRRTAADRVRGRGPLIPPDPKM